MVSLHPGKIEITVRGDATSHIVADPRTRIVASHNPRVVKSVKMEA
jgi:hypothetical protein